MQPKVSYRIELTIQVNESPTKEKVTSVYIDGNKLQIDQPDNRGNKGTYFYKVRPGTHLIEWRLGGDSKKYSQKIYVDHKDQSIDLIIDGDNFYRK